jgi:signal transduction histidine kinase
VHDRDEFLSVAAHELKTPLTSLSAFAQVLLRCLQAAGSVDPARLGRALANVETQAGKVNRLVDQLLDVTRLDAGRLVLEQRPTDLSELLREAVEAAQAQTTQHTLVVQALPVLCAWVDALRLEQVFTNLLGNAIKFSPQGGTITCTLRAEPGGDTVQVAVRDQGIGIPPEQRAHIFDRFYQAHASSYRSGLGLGLYISQQIVALHRGHISAEFPPEGGSLFVIRPPRGGERMECNATVPSVSSVLTPPVHR